MSTGRVDVEGLTIGQGLGVDGGAVHVDLGGDLDLHIVDARISSSTAHRGGGLWFGGGTLTMSGTEVLANLALYDGGGVYLESLSGLSTVADCELAGNEAQADYLGGYHGGGALYLGSGDLDIEGTSFVNNRAAWLGGAMYLHNTAGGRVDVEGSSFISNGVTQTATFPGVVGGGGGVAITSGELDIRNTDFIGQAVDGVGTGAGGAVLVTAEWLGGAPDVAVRANSTFVENRADNGGAMAAWGRGELTVSNSSFSENEAANGGALALVGDAGATVDDSAIDGSTASSGGGAIVAGHASLVSGCTTWAANAPEDVLADDSASSFNFTGVVNFVCSSTGCGLPSACP